VFICGSDLPCRINAGQALFGGTTPMVATYLVARSHDDLSPGFYLMTMAAVSLVAALGLGSEHSRRRF